MPDAGSREARVLADRYELRQRLGAGGMGAVWLAWDRRMRCKVAVKELVGMPRVLAPDEVSARLERECRAQARLQDPGVVQFRELGRDGGFPFLVMELVDGPSLAGAIEKARREGRRGWLANPRQVAQAFRELAWTLDKVHRTGVVHRDIKPSNILVDRQEGSVLPRLRLVDFGLASLADPEEPSLHTQGIVGTQAYMAPEQIAGRPAGKAADLWALGACLYEALTLERLVQGRTFQEIQAWHRRGTVTGPRARNPDVPRDLDAICLQALREEPGRRYPSAGDLAADLDRFLAWQPVQARPSPLWLRVRSWVRRHPVQSTVHTALVLGLAVVSGLLWMNHRARVAAETQRDNLAVASRLTGEFMETVDPSLADRRGLEIRQRLRQWESFLETRLQDQPEVAARLLVAVGKALLRYDDYQGAEAPLRSAVALATRAAEEGHGDPDTLLQARLHLGWALGRAYRLQEAEALLRGVLRELEPGSYSHLLATNRLGQVLLEQKRLEESLACFQEVRQRLPDGGGEVAGLWALNELDLGVLKMLLEDYEGALASFRRSREAFLEAYGPYHPELPYVYRGLSDAFRGLGRTVEALEALYEASRLRARIQTPRDFEVVRDHSVLAIFLAGLGFRILGLQELGAAVRSTTPEMAAQQVLTRGLVTSAAGCVWPLPWPAAVGLAWGMPPPTPENWSRALAILRSSSTEAAASGRPWNEENAHEATREVAVPSAPASVPAVGARPGGGPGRGSGAGPGPGRTGAGHRRGGAVPGGGGPGPGAPGRTEPAGGGG